MTMTSLTKLAISLTLISLIIVCSGIALTKGASIINADPSDGVVTSTGGINDSGNSFWVGDEASPPNAVLRSFVKFSLAGVPEKISSVTLKLNLLYSYGGAVNIGLGDCLVIHIDDFDTLDPTDFNAPSIGNDPGVLFSGSINPSIGYVSIDVTSAMQDDIDNGRAFTSFMIKMAIDTDGDGEVDRWHFASIDGANSIGYDPPIIEYELPAVGGIITPINKLEIITPYLVLGLVISVSAIVIMKRE
jgi:hypothetical protein